MLTKGNILLVLIIALSAYYLYQIENPKKIYKELISKNIISLEKLKKETLVEIIKIDNRSIEVNKENMQYYVSLLNDYTELNSILYSFDYSLNDLESCEPEDYGYDLSAKIECSTMHKESLLYQEITENCEIHYDILPPGAEYYPEYALGEIKCSNNKFGRLFSKNCEAEGGGIQCSDYPGNPLSNMSNWNRETLPKEIRAKIKLLIDQKENNNINYFKGFRCTNDCSGHRAGYSWAKQKNHTNRSDCQSNSQSFIEGCWAFVDGR